MNRSNGPANDNDSGAAVIARHATPISLSSANCVALTGMSWSWVLRFARAHGVPVWRVGARKQLVAGAAFLDAMDRAATNAPPVTEADELARLRAEFSRKYG